MTEWTSISLTQTQKDTLKEAKESANHEGSMGAFLVNAIESNSNGSKQELLEEIHAELDRLEDEVSTSSLEDRDFDDWFEPDYAKTIAEHIRRELEQQSGGDNADELRELKGRLDDLESQLPRKVAQELGQ